MNTAFSNILPLGEALKTSLKHGYPLGMFKKDVLAALIVSWVALPLAMALSIAVGLSPQHGLYTAIIAGMIVPLLGGSRFQVSGPTAAFVVVVAPIVTTHGLRGLILATIMAGICLMVMGITKCGRYIQYIPYPVTTGFTSGIAVVIGTLALNDFLGLYIDKLQGGYLHNLTFIITRIPVLYWPEASVGIVSLFVMVISKYALPRVPSPVVGIAVGIAMAYMLEQKGFHIATIGNRFNFSLSDMDIGEGIRTIFATMPHWSDIHPLLVPALVIAVLGALESLLSATVADGMAATKHNPHAELIAIGVGNVLSGLASGIPATGAIARTSTNIHGGAVTPIASSLHAVCILCYVLLLTPYMVYIPMASLAALLIVVAYHMSHWRQCLRIIQIAPRSDILVLGACFLCTVLIDMVAGVTVGVVLACMLLIKRIGDLTHSDITSATVSLSGRKEVLLPEDAMIYRIQGPLCFATVQKALSRVDGVVDNIRILILDMEQVPFIDMTGLVALKAIVMDMQSKNKTIILCGKHGLTEKLLQKLPDAARKKINFFNTLPEGVAFGLSL